MTLLYHYRPIKNIKAISKDVYAVQYLIEVQLYNQAVEIRGLEVMEDRREGQCSKFDGGLLFLYSE